MQDNTNNKKIKNENKKIIRKNKKIALLIAMALFLVPVASCAQKVNFLISTVTPAAKGNVKVKKDSNKNYRIKIHIVNLAEPARLSPPRTAYVYGLLQTIMFQKTSGK